MGKETQAVEVRLAESLSRNLQTNVCLDCASEPHSLPLFLYELIVRVMV